MVVCAGTAMQRPVPWFWIVLGVLLLLAPTAMGRVLLDVLGGLTLAALLLPLILGVAGVVGWQVLRRRLRTCEVCGFSALGAEQCPACGAPYAPSSDAVGSSTRLGAEREIDASQVTIDVEVLPDSD
jgi:hypothetical protein